MAQQQRSVQNTRSAAGGVEDSRGASDGAYPGGVSRLPEREGGDERKLHGKRSSGSASTLSRDVDSAGGMQSHSIGGGGMASSRMVGTSLNLMAPTTASMAPKPTGQSAGISGASPMQSHLITGLKPGGGRSKGSGVSAPAASVAPRMSTQPSFTERNAAVSGSVAGKAGQSIPSGQGGKSGPPVQQMQMKLNQRPAPGPLSASNAVPAGQGTHLQEALAATMAKNPQGQQTHRATQGGGNASAGSIPRMGTPAAAASSVSSGTVPVPLSPMALPTKSSGLNPGKSNSSQKSYPLTQKGNAGASGGGGKRSSSPSSGVPVPSILGSSLLSQSMSGKSSQQSHMQIQGQGPGQAPGQSQGLQQHVGGQSQGPTQGQGASPQLQQQLLQQQHKQSSYVQQQQQQQQQMMIRQHVYQQQFLHQQVRSLSLLAATSCFIASFHK